MGRGDKTNERALIQRRRAREIGTLGLGRPAPIVLAYPSPYHVGMSSLGFQTLYRALNEDGPGCHRAFLPDRWERMSLAWPQPRRPILSYETEQPLSSYRIIGLSVAYELEISGVIRLLEGAGIPLLAADRGPRDPIIIGGGPLTNSNPSVLLPFVDLLIAGEAEALLPEAVARIEQSRDRQAAIDAVAELPHTIRGEVEPGHFEPLPSMANAPAKLLPARSAIVSPDTELSEMFLIEPERGCSRRCTFCVMRGATTGGMRLLDIETPLALIPDHAKKVGLVGAAVTDHPQLEQLVARIVERGKGIGISSLRADRLTPSLLRGLADGGYRTITVASDGISERMRLALDRKVTEAELLRAAKLISAGGFHRMKVYQMMGAPGETDDDADELIRFSLELAKIVRLTLTFSTFVAKRNTPLDGSPFFGVKPAQARLDRIRQGLKGKVELRPQPPKWAWIEYLLAQGGPEVGHAAIEAVHAGASYRDWARALESLAPTERAPCYGDEWLVARRTGKAAERPRLPVLPPRAPA
ncbi:B12-binding domain-containing radical SAM protein [Enhygromyxa salina]|uniref:Radical SAM superfamily protein n=1 Tax=Enhygromyxa salina TaxID=215803 RepID=A0A2S9YQK2_9BACT|nr:radical SAM protein [Enhygromyxa salina]PRQ07339.1 Radical SAM superfamily protein [Enhygromyxa salina]